MKFKTCVLGMFFSINAIAEGFHNCTGKIEDIITRATFEDTKVKIENMEGYARLGYGGAEFGNMHTRQFSMLLSAFMADKEVTLEFLDKNMLCTDSHDNELIRFVRLRN